MQLTLKSIITEENLGYETWAPFLTANNCLNIFSLGLQDVNGNDLIILNTSKLPKASLTGKKSFKDARNALCL